MFKVPYLHVFTVCFGILNKRTVRTACASLRLLPQYRLQVASSRFEEGPMSSNSHSKHKIRLY